MIGAVNTLVKRKDSTFALFTVTKKCLTKNSLCAVITMNRDEKRRIKHQWNVILVVVIVVVVVQAFRALSKIDKYVGKVINTYI